jgi:hypothetical protein
MHAANASLLRMPSYESKGRAELYGAFTLWHGPLQWCTAYQFKAGTCLLIYVGSTRLSPNR